MRIYLIVAIYTFVFVSIAGCYKNIDRSGSSALTIVNTVVGSAPLVTNFNSVTGLSSYAGSQQLTYGTYSSTKNVFGSFSGAVDLMLYQIPDTMAHSAPLYNLTMDLPVGSIHSLFLTGYPGQPEYLLTVDELPYHSVNDSVVGIRFVNLSPNSSPVSINVMGKPNGSEVQSLPYKGISNFASYSATSTFSNYTFQFRDANTGALLTSFALGNINVLQNSIRFRNVTIMLYGLIGGVGTSVLKTGIINNY